MAGGLPGDAAEEGAPVGLDLVVPLAPLQEHSTFVRWTSGAFSHFSSTANCESKELEMADLEVVLKKECFLILTLSPHSYH
jgi:hypothetical protein